jgi:hypothetical protein
MAARDSLHPDLFHGTSSWIAPGDIIRPGKRDEFYGPGAYRFGTHGKDPDVGVAWPEDEHTSVGAYATPDVQVGKKFAKQGMETEADRAGVTPKRKYDDASKKFIDVGYSMPKDAEPFQPALFAPVYPVEHVTEHADPHGRIANTPSEGSRTHRRDKVGFRVTGNPVDYAYYNDPDSFYM